MSEGLEKVAIVNGICVKNDAISASVRDDALSFCREHGFLTKVFTFNNEMDDIDAVVVRNVGDIIFNPFFVSCNLIIYHFGIYYELFDAIFVGNGRAPQVVRYHNLTPRALLPPGERRLYDRSSMQLYNMTTADAVWPVSDINRFDIIDRKIVPAAKVEMIPLCVGDGQRRRSLKDKAFDAVRLLYVGRFVEAKGLADLIQAVGKLRDAGLPLRLRLVGEQKFSHPDYVESLKALIGELDLEREVAFVGSVSDEALLSEYDEAHIVVVPSHHEGFCKPVIEAMRSGCLPVTYDAYNLRYVARGLSRTAPTGDVGALTARIGEAARAILPACNGAAISSAPCDLGPLPLEEYESRVDVVLAEYGFPMASAHLRHAAGQLAARSRQVREEVRAEGGSGSLSN